MDEDFKELTNQLGDLHVFRREAAKQTLLMCTPEVERIVSTNNLDIDIIEHTLDALCEVAFDDEVLFLFKKLLRYYYKIDIVATAEHIKIYREMWDNDKDEEQD
ncbi:MAG: hypothetical protein DRJ05_00415 [Bacteroidetes bacterium]|nr:MAG: hypothetical protein DRJ05_00415 [Bacteroidota bacterium]